MTVAGLVSASAQVYSVNVAGYVTMQLTNGYNLINNPLQCVVNGVTNNAVDRVLGTTNIPNGTFVYVLDTKTLAYSNCSYSSLLKKWSGATNTVNNALRPGGGIFFKLAGTGYTLTNFTFVGNVMQGALTNPVAVGYQFVGSQVPQGGTISTNLNYTPANGDLVYKWLVPQQKYDTAYSYSSLLKKWNPSQPIVNVGEAILLNAKTGAKWNRNFTVQ